MHTEFWSENLKGRNHWEYMYIDGNILSKCILKQTGCESVDLNHMVQNKNQWWDLVNIVMNLWVP
jgi:hypothetical protein